MQKTCIVIPCYNEEKRLPVEEFVDFFHMHDDFDFCFVNDGSKDNTLGVIEKLLHLDPDRIFVVDLKQNVGKAEAVRKGILYSLQNDKYSYFGYFDADFATPLSELDTLMDAFIRNEECLFVVGSRIKRLGANINRKTHRHYTGRIFATAASMILRLPVYDTQCGAKLLKRSVVEVMFAEQFISRWLFDVEIFARLTANIGYKNILDHIYEVPLNCWIEKGGSSLQFSYMYKVPVELFRISRKYHLGLTSKGIQSPS
ncbi:MAG: glycosyltransferase [Bacteroidetes bacterium]|nr:glycosyltransferase [Bacteroidota bacterium]